MRTLFMMFSFCCFLAQNVMGVNTVVNLFLAGSSGESAEIVITVDEDFTFSDAPGNKHRSMLMPIPFSAFLNDDRSIDLDFYQAVGEIGIVNSQNGTVVYSSVESINSPALRKIQLQQGLSGDFLLEVRGEGGGYAFGEFTL